MAISVLHVALTPLAGSPVRIVEALNRLTDIDARLVVLNPGAYGAREFAGDLDWKSNGDEARDFLRKADIVHLHHFFELENNPFRINFHELCDSKVRFIRQFHSTPMTVACGDSVRAQGIVRSEIAQLVIAQYPERFFPRARIVPNVVPLNHSLYLPAAGRNAANPSVFFSPSRDEAAWSVQSGQTRWDTKGALETERLLERVTTSCRRGQVIVRRNIPHERCLREKQLSDIVIDEMVTGSFHLTSLEALAQGLPTFAYLDARCLETLNELVGTHTNPWLNFRLEEAEKPLIELITDEGLRKEVGAFARDWMEKYYSDREMIGYYVRAYKDLLERPEVFQKPRFDFGSRRQVFWTQKRDDLVWEARKARISREQAEFDMRPDNPPAVIRNKQSPIPSWIKTPVHGFIRKYTSVRVDEIQAIENRLTATEALLGFVSISEANRWLYQNRSERMDATLPIFDEQRRTFHIDRYRFAAERVKGRQILDCACGTGYGIRLLREQGEAASAIGVDIEGRAIAYARQKHGVHASDFICASGDSLPLGDNSFDVVTSFETIEHVPDDAALVEEFYRVLRPEGTLIISTPNQWPLADTPHHVREYDRNSFLKVLEPRFDCVELYNQNSGSDTPLNHGQPRGIVVTTSANESLAECYIAVCKRKVSPIESPHHTVRISVKSDCL